MRPILAAALVLFPVAAAEAQEGEARPPLRTRVALGPGVTPRYPGSDQFSFRPVIAIDRARGDDPFRFEAPDESFSPPLIRAAGFTLGPSVNFEGKRRSRDTDGRLDPVGFTVEAGGYVNYQLTPGLRLRIEARQGIGGHKGLIAIAGADVVARDGDRWLFSIGPRATFTNGRYNRAYFGVSPEESARSGLAAFRPDGGLQAVGATAGALAQFTDRWGVYGFAKYDRLVDDAARSPEVRRFGSRDQLTGGVALTYTFGRGMR